MSIRVHPLAAVFALLSVSLVASSCKTDRSSSASSTVEAESTTAKLRIEEIRARFTSVIHQGVATGFERQENSVRVLLRPPQSLRSPAGLKRAVVDLPLRASDPVRLEDASSKIAVTFALRGARDNAALQVSSGVALYREGFGGDADIIHRVHDEGTEDFIVFEKRPAKESIAYDVVLDGAPPQTPRDGLRRSAPLHDGDVTRVAGLRLIGNTLEMLDVLGTPRLRIAPPYAVDAHGHRTEASLTVEGCAVDTNPAPPWGRDVVVPQASRCVVHVGWHADVYPAIVDPTWSATGSMATARMVHTTTLLGTNKVLVAGGQGDLGVSLTSCELYDATSGTFAATGGMTTGREDHRAVLLGTGKVLVAGGRSGGPLTQTAGLYDPGAGTFSNTGSLQAPRSSFTATLLATGNVLAAGGGAAGSPLSTAEIYSVGGGSFALTGSLTMPRYLHAAALLNSGKVLVAGGSNVSGTQSSAELYDPGTSSFTATGSLITKRSEPSATLLPSGKVLVAGGYNQNPTFTAELFDPAGAGSFVATGSMTNSHVEHTATALFSGKVLLVAGNGAPINGSTTVAEIFDPAGAGSFTAIGSLATPRRGHAAVRLASGRVLISGGTTQPLLSSAELLGLALGGSGCSIPDDCASGSCEEGVCCTSACAGACKTCTAGTGACVTVTNADDASSCTGASTCDAAGACKLKTSQPCPGGAGTCASGSCSDGFCCGSACTGACDVCSAALGSTSNGVCQPAPVNSAGSPACGSGLACNGVSAVCPTTCLADNDCLLTNYCAADGTCKPRKAQAAACNTTAGQDCKAAGCHVCAVGACVDGVCCESACAQSCYACVAALKQDGSPDGLCGPAKDDTNPHNDICADNGPALCGPNGKCNGTGGCRLYYKPGTSCSVSGNTCDVATNKALGSLCDGAGLCKPEPAGVACGDYKCAAGSCPSSCTTDAQCTSNAYCRQGSCIPKGANGVSCTAGEQCGSGLCAQGVCCNSACQGQCGACDAPATKGTCTPIVGPPHEGKPACAPADPANPCAQALCDGQVATSCTGFVGSTIACRPASCENGTQTLPASCDGKGSCPAVVTKKCDPFTCDGATSACKTTCMGDADCVIGNKCDPASKKCVSGATCNDHIVTDATGKTTDCAPYNCEGNGSCKTTCGSVSDCAAPNVCDETQHCIAPPSSAGEESGCSVSSSSQSRSNNAGGYVALFFIGVAFRRRYRRRTSRARACSKSASFSDA